MDDVRKMSQPSRKIMDYEGTSCPQENGTSKGTIYMKRFIRTVLIAAATLAVLFSASTYADAQGVRAIAQKNDANAPGLIIGPVAAGQEADGLLANLNEKILADFKNALALAQTKDAAGKDADPIAAPCLAAVIPVLELISKDAVTAEGDGVVTKVVKARILRMKLQSQELQIACAPWKQDARSQILQGAKDVLGLLFGAMKFGLL